MTRDQSDVETEAMRAGAEVEQSARDDEGVEHTSRTQPPDKKPVLTTDPEAQQEESVIEPTSS